MAQHGPQGVVTGTADNVHEIGRGPDAPLRVMRGKGAVGPCSQQILYYRNIWGKSGGGEGIKKYPNRNILILQWIFTQNIDSSTVLHNHVAHIVQIAN